MHLTRLLLMGACFSAITENKLHQVLRVVLMSEIESKKDQLAFSRSRLNLTLS